MSFRRNPRSFLRLLAAVALLAPMLVPLLVAESAFAGAGPGGGALRIGDPAPRLVVDRWLRGAPVPEFRPGKFYLVEFWATWCHPCVDSIPHLIEIARKFPGIEVIGVAASEGKKTSRGDIGGLERFLTKEFPDLNYRIAYDRSGDSRKVWMEAAGEDGIPSSFIVDGRGRIVFIGHPVSFEDSTLLPAILDGSWERSGRMAKFAADRERSQRVQAGVSRAEKALAAARAEAEKPTDDPALARSRWENVLRLARSGYRRDPFGESFIRAMLDAQFHHLGAPDAGYADAVKMLRKIRSDDAFTEVYFRSMILDTLVPHSARNGVPFAMRMRLGETLVTQIAKAIPADEAARGESTLFLYYPPVAEYFFQAGRRDEAIALAEAMIAQAKKVKYRDQYLPGLAALLADYSGEKVCVGKVCAMPTPGGYRVEGMPAAPLRVRARTRASRGARGSP